MRALQPISQTATQTSRKSDVTLGMAQLAVQGLSEDWWLKHLGDVHWQLIADAMGQKDTVFRDAQGRQLYAAFCATEFDQLSVEHSQLGAQAQVHSTLWAAGKSRMQSSHVLRIQGQDILRVRLVTTFVVHEKAGTNSSISRAQPRLLPVLPQAPDTFAQHAAKLTRLYKTPELTEPQTTITPSVGTDFNAVGLLYFPSFSRFLETAEHQLRPSPKWAPVRKRLVLYFGNIEVGETVGVAEREPSETALTQERHLMLLSASGAKIAHGFVSRFTS